MRWLWFIWLTENKFYELKHWATYHHLQLTVELKRDENLHKLSCCGIFLQNHLSNSVSALEWLILSQMFIKAECMVRTYILIQFNAMKFSFIYLTPNNNNNWLEALYILRLRPYNNKVPTILHLWQWDWKHLNSKFQVNKPLNILKICSVLFYHVINLM